MAATMMRQRVAGAIAGERRAVAAPRMGGASRVVAPVVASANASAFKGQSVAARTKRTVRAARVQSRRTAVVTEAKIGDSLAEFLVAATPDPKLRQLMMSMAEAIRTIAHKVRTASCAGTACVNSFGDEQLAIDMLADKILFEALQYSHVCKLACSEEVPEPLDMGGEGFCVAFDPLDGSSIVDTNFSVGTIFGVWPGDQLTNITGREQVGGSSGAAPAGEVAAGMGIYGPRTVFCIALKDAPNCHEFLLMDDGKWMHVKETSEIGEGKMFSPGNLRATFDNPAYERLIDFYISEKYTLRYTGGMVPDVFQILVKEKGVFTNVTSPTTKAKLRILFEVAPLALMVEKAGGASSCDGKCVSALDIPILVCDQRTQIAFGSVGEVRRFEEYMYGTSARFSAVAV
ncbi:Sedoheptulose-1,7-bisphosphatase, chloroplastic [Tetrabaena socialis]|uniref:Sedoheptulose-1,7-bisphosphatase, chloroplastic n=1 Tax=Tetrabaena socialis TaxID=47790 RepID=A0A2J8AIU3_9CHLO|nr:Sedoheptulose-1,7-bisphosphatase, chloroplastic [Tetrabaena socialis]|eukprot:PNH12434.1 Sedoheptulose-1,7-bisphosphatase, chloroplastic [Tetrabaena socialis]